MADALAARLGLPHQKHAEDRMNHPEIYVAGFWILSAAASTMPPVTENAPYGVRWAHDFFQALAANLNKVGQRNQKSAAQ